MKTLTAKKYVSNSLSLDSFPGVYQFENGLTLVLSPYDRDWFVDDIADVECDDLIEWDTVTFSSKELLEAWKDSEDVSNLCLEHLPKVKALLK